MGLGRSKLRLALIVVSLGLLFIVGAVLAIRGRKAAKPGYARPLVTLLLKCPGPTAPKDEQYRNVIVEVDKPIPDGPAPGLESDLVLADRANEVIFGLGLNLAMNHPRTAEVKIAISAVSPDGKEILKTQVLWVGPDAERGGSTPGSQATACFRLHWADGSLLPATYWVESISIEKGSAILRWSITPDRSSEFRVNSENHYASLRTWNLELRPGILFLPRPSQRVGGQDGVGHHVGGDLERLVVDRLARGRGAAGDLGRGRSAGSSARPISASVIGRPTSVEKPSTCSTVARGAPSSTSCTSRPKATFSPCR